MADNYENVRTHVIEPVCCRRCDDEKGLIGIHARFIGCKTCGNKRCPKATDHRLECTDSNEPGQPGSDYEGQPVTRNRPTPESREFWDSAEKAAAPVADWPDSKRAGINVSDRRTLTCAVCCRPAPGGISYTVAGKRHELCDMHPGMANHDVARIVALRAANVRLVSENEALKRELHRWQTGNEIEGDHVEHWIARSDYEELERHASDLERQLLDLTAERDRLLKGFADATDKCKVYRREIRRLQRALLVERGKGLSELEARVEALEGRRGEA